MSKQILLPSRTIVEVIKACLLSKRQQLTEYHITSRYTPERIAEGDVQLEECLVWMKQFEEMQNDAQ